MSNAKDKIFGLENFGNSCYCNSVLQCLFHVRPFRDHILALNNVEHAPHTSTPGAKDHVVEESTLPLSVGSPSIATRLKLRKEKQDILEPPAQLEGLDIGPFVPGMGIPVVGYTEDPAASPEIRKRAALTKGPIVNLDHSLAKEYGMEDSMLSALKDLFMSIQENSSSTGVAVPNFFVELLKQKNDLFRSSMHQDAHEFYSFLLNTIFELLPEEQWVRDMFEGRLTNELKCVTCETSSYRDEKFLDLSLDLEDNTSINQCLKQFSKSEVLGGLNKFHCDHCGALEEAHKRLKVRHAPKVLTLHLKRFKYSEQDNENIKLQHRVVYSKYLRLPVVTGSEENALYELKSVIVHLGGGPYQGHYVSVVKTEAGWMLFDDECVEAVDDTYVFKFFGDSQRLTCAYVLFYQQIDQETFERDNLYVTPDVTHLDADSVFSASDVSSSVFSDDGQSRRYSEVDESKSGRRRNTVSSMRRDKPDSKLFGIFRKPSSAGSP